MKNAYVEITNVCNLSCDFCPGHKRAKKHMSAEEFSEVLRKIEGEVETVFLHVMGEPLLHPELDKIIERADRADIKLKITTNGTLLCRALPTLCASKNLRTVCISVHSFEGNDGGDFEKYIKDCFEGARALAESGKYAVLRLWNLEKEESAENRFNADVLRRLESFFSAPRDSWTVTHRGYRIVSHVFLEWGERFDWPDITEAPTEPTDTEAHCQGLLTQFGILSDGTIIPCCLDRNGDIALGNIFETSLADALASPRAKRMRDAMSNHRYAEPLCFSCGFFRR
ncbi:MAG: radical SAM protein [Ruminococcaceae bacterium]|nr:radical SAM protein [Oscillospiraceae bacterium]